MNPCWQQEVFWGHIHSGKTVHDYADAGSFNSFKFTVNLVDPTSGNVTAERNGCICDNLAIAAVISCRAKLDKERKSPDQLLWSLEMVVQWVHSLQSFSIWFSCFGFSVLLNKTIPRNQVTDKRMSFVANSVTMWLRSIIWKTNAPLIVKRQMLTLWMEQPETRLNIDKNIKVFRGWWHITTYN